MLWALFQLMISSAPFFFTHFVGGSDVVRRFPSSWKILALSSRSHIELVFPFSQLHGKTQVPFGFLRLIFMVKELTIE